MNTLLDLLNDFESSNYIGFDRMFQNMRSYGYPKRVNYPPHNILRKDHNYLIQIAIAGFRRDDIDIQVKEDVLTIVGKKEPQELSGSEYISRGIAERNFELSFSLADTIVVDGAKVEDGMLTIALHNEIPEHRKARKIEITNEIPREQELLLG
jgi:molecular chaperone IbpA